MRACNEELRLFPEVVDALSAVRQAGWRMGLLTNGPSDGQRKKIECLGLSSFFDAIAIGEEIGFFKPDPRAFALCLEMVGESAARTWVVGDSIELDVLPAIAAGLRTILVLRSSTEPMTRAPSGVLVAADLSIAARFLSKG